MKKLLLFLLPVVLAVIVFAGFVFFLQRNNTAKGALQVTSLPQSAVYINDKLIGKTPLCKCDGPDMLVTGDYTIRLVPVDNSKQPYEEKISINPSVLTVVDRTFGDIGQASGSVISLTPIKDSKTAQLFIASFPYGANVSVDSNPSGTTPALLQNITDSDHEVTLTKDGYQPKTIRIHGVLGYKLSAIVTLATALTSAASSPTPIPSGQPTPSVTPTPTGGLQTPQVTILDTPTGFLRVRDSASLGGTEIAQVHPGETYPLVSEQDGWYQIKLSDGRIGWVSSSYAKKE